MILVRLISNQKASLSRKSQHGFSLLELLISLLIFAISFLGLASLQQLSLQLTHDASLQNTAMQLSQNLIERMRISGGTIPMADWEDEVAAQLPKGQALLNASQGIYSLQLSWQESPRSESPENMQRFQTRFKIRSQ